MPISLMRSVTLISIEFTMPTKHARSDRMISSRMLSLEPLSWISTPAACRTASSTGSCASISAFTILFMICMYVRKAMARTTPDIVTSDRKKRRLIPAQLTLNVTPQLTCFCSGIFSIVTVVAIVMVLYIRLRSMPRRFCIVSEMIMAMKTTSSSPMMRPMKRPRTLAYVFLFAYFVTSDLASHPSRMENQ